MKVQNPLVVVLSSPNATQQIRIKKAIMCVFLGEDVRVPLVE